MYKIVAEDSSRSYGQPFQSLPPLIVDGPLAVFDNTPRNQAKFYTTYISGVLKRF